MNPTLTSACVLVTLAAHAVAQGPDMLVTFSNPEVTLSTSGGTVLQMLRPNEVCHLEWTFGPCMAPSAEKFVPQAAFHVMAGDEDGDGTYFEANLFGRIDALCEPFGSTAGTPGMTNARNLFFSPSVAMGTNISGGPGLRPGDVGRIVRNTFGDGQVEYFMRREQFNQALGLPLATPTDVDAICFQPGLGVYFSLDQDVPAVTFCGPQLIQDGAIVCVPDWAITWTPDFRVAAVLPNSAAVVYSEVQVDAMVVAANVADRNGACLVNAVDLESLDFDWSAPIGVAFPCSGAVVQAPHFVFSVETGTGASLLTTVGGGAIYNHFCGAAATPCGFGPTLGNQMGVRPPTAAQGVASYVNALAFTRTHRFVTQPQAPVVTAPFGAPLGATQIDYRSPYPWNLALIELVPATVPGSLPAFPFSLLCFPDLYAPSLFVHFLPAPGQWGSFPMVAIPPAFSGKVLYQMIGFGGSGLELSTPTVIDVN